MAQLETLVFCILSQSTLFFKVLIIFIIGPQNNPGFPDPEREARRVLDSYGGRTHYSENDDEAGR